MKKRWISIMLVIALLSTSAVFAADAPEIQNSLSGEVNNYNESEITMPSDAEVTAMDGLREQLYGGVDNSDLEVDIVWEKSGKKRVIYSGRLGGYLFGIYRHVDFTGIEYQIIFSTLGVTDDVIYIVPKSDKPIEDVMDELTPEGDGKFSNGSVTSESTIKCDVNLMYDGTYHEKIMIKNKQLTVPIKLTNTGSAAKDITCFIGEYDADGRLINEVESTPVRVGANTSVAATLIREFDSSAKSAKIFIWEDGTMRPVTNTILLTETETDYYANSLTQAQEYDIAYPIEGRINTSGDVDYIKFVPETSGEYTIRCINVANILTTLYNSNQTVLNSNSADFTYSLTAGQVYYLRVFGSNTMGEYVLSIQYNMSEAVQGFDIYKFDVNIGAHKKEILDICESLYSKNLSLSKEIYSDYEKVLNADAELHTLPGFLSGHPKEISNFDELLNQYYSTKYDKFMEIKERYLEILKSYDGEGGYNKPGTVGTPSGAKTPLFKSDFTNTSEVTQTTESYDSNSEYAVNAAIPALTIKSTTSTSITYTATFPVSGAQGNAIYLVDFEGRDGSSAWNSVYTKDGQPDVWRENGTFTITNLVPGGEYIVTLAWSTDGGSTYGGENSINRRVRLPYNTTEQKTLYKGKYVNARMESADKNQATVSNFNTWLNRMDSVYLALQDLTGYTPYGGRPIELNSSRLNMSSEGGAVDGQNYWELIYGWSGNPVDISQPHYRSLMRRLAQGDWSDVAIHELSHDFDNIAWEFDPEVLAFLKIYYVLTKLNGKVYRSDVATFVEENYGPWYTGADYYNFLKYDFALGSYTKFFAQGEYGDAGMASILIDIQKQIGWEPFKKTFRYFNGLSKSQIPKGDGAKLKLFLTKLKDYSGQDVLNEIINRDKNIIEDWFNIDLEYVEPVYPSVTPGGSSGGGRYDVNIDKGNYTTYQFTPSTSGNYYIYTTPYGGSGVSNDTVLEVYTNSSLSGTPIASNDDYDGGRFSKVNVAMTAGTTYYIKVRHYNNGTLHAELNITKNIPVQQLTSGGYQDAYTAAGEYAMFSFTPDTSMTYVFEVTNTSNYEPYIKLYENESMTKRIGYGSTKIMANLKAGHTYYLQFSGFLMKYARGRVTVRQGQTVQFSKKNDSSFIYVNSPEFLISADIVDDAKSEDLKIFEQQSISGKNTYFQTHLAWYGEGPDTDFYIDIDFYNPTNGSVEVDISNLAYGVNYDVLTHYFAGGQSKTLTIPAHEHRLLFESFGAPLLCSDSRGEKWARLPIILFDFNVRNGNVTVSSLAAYNRSNLILRNGEKNVLNSNGKILDTGEIIYELNRRPNESDLYGKYKGIAKNQSSWVDASLDFVIDGTSEAGKELYPYLKDSEYPSGFANPKEKWITNINPINDKFGSLIYAMPSQLHRFEYSRNIGGMWNFAYNYRDLREINESATGTQSINKLVDNTILNNVKADVALGWQMHTSGAPDDHSISMGEWGTTTHYTITVDNQTDETKEVSYRVSSFENLIFGYKLANSTSYTPQFLEKAGYEEWKSPITVPIDSYSSVTFEVVTLSAAGGGGIHNSIYLNK